MTSKFIGAFVFYLFFFFCLNAHPQTVDAFVSETGGFSVASFRLLDRKKIEAQMLQRIADATPKSLPQKPVSKAVTDLRDANLQGRVKSVLEKTAGYNPTGGLMEEKNSSYKEFSENGYLVKSYSYKYFMINVIQL
jgi:hypothetical protein